MRHIVGIDCAAQDKNCGIALGRFSSDRLEVLEVTTRLDTILPQLVDWLGGCAPALVAIDAPLGWPASMGATLSGHLAGEPMVPSANNLFHRETDRVVREHTRKRPMEVGADKIARAALRAVNLIGELRSATGLALPLAWAHGPQAESAVIEVYPATTLRARGLQDSGYKGAKPQARAARTGLISDLAAELDFALETNLLVDSDDALDAVLCLLAGSDFLRGNVVPPVDLARARQEGWIWFRDQSSEVTDKKTSLRS